MPQSSKRSRKMPIRAFRIEEETIKKLDQISTSENRSINAIVNTFLKEYTDFILPAIKYDSKIIQGKILRKLVDEIDTKRLETIGREMGEDTFRELNDARWLSKNTLSFKKIVHELFCDSANWASCFESKRGNKVFIDMTHHMGLKWSIFLKNFFYWELMQLEDIKITDVEFLCSESNLVISIPEYEPNR